MNVCQQHVWHRSSTGWKQEDDPEGWSVQREYQTKQCSNCSATLFIRPLGVRRCYRLDLQSTEQPALLKNLNAKQWRTIEALIPKMNRNRFEVLERLSEWAEAGWVEVEETWIDPGWQIERVRLSPLLVSQKTEQQDQAQDERERQAIAYLLNVLHQWRIEYQEAVKKHYAESDLVAIIERLYTLFEEQERALDAGTCVPLAGTTMMPGGSPHQRWLALLRGILDLLAKPRLEHERIFSAKWLHDSKAFRKERDALEAFLSIEGGLQRVGLVKHTPVVLSWGAWQAAWNGFLLDGQAAFSFAAMPADTLAQVHEMQVEARSLFIVENQTPFEILVHPQRRDAQTLYLYGAGFPGQAQRELTALW